MRKPNASGASPPLNTFESATAQRPCSSCRKRRRKCDRTLPGCLECKHLDRTCQYVIPSKKQAQKTGRFRIKPNDDKRTARAIVGHPNTKFHFAHGIGPTFLARPKGFSIEVSIPRSVLQLLGGQIESIQDKYFRCVHRWMPIISTKRLRRLAKDVATEPRADLALLLLCMKLITDHPTPNTIDWARSDLYHSAKSLHRSIRSAKRYSTHFLQAGLLISLYELGHAIHPEAQTSVVANAELGMKLGINEAASQSMDPVPSSWTESEERTRTWWGIMILDRHVSLGIRGRQLSTPDPDGSQYVPVDDVAWEDGFEDTPVLRKTLAAETPALPGAGIFEREAHASYLLGQVVNLKLDETLRRPSHIDSRQLSNTLRSLSSLLKHDIDTVNGPYYCAAVGMCNSALLALHTPAFLSNSSSAVSTAETYRELMMCKRAADRVLELGITFFANIEWPGLVDTIAPLVPDSIYQAGVVYGFLARETDDQSYRDAYDMMRRALLFFDTRWKVARSYLRLLDQQFGTASSAWVQCSARTDADGLASWHVESIQEAQWLTADEVSTLWPEALTAAG